MNQRNETRKEGLSVLITGGSGTIGRYLTAKLIDEGHKVSHLSRRTDCISGVKVFRWNPEAANLDPGVFDGIDCLVHLAGANIGEKRWTGKRKDEISDSRIKTAELLVRTIVANRINLRSYITASATGYYGTVTCDKIFSEEDPPSGDFLGSTCRLWEECAEQLAVTGIRTVKLRTAIVLEKNDSALSRLMMPARFGFVTRLGNGLQYFPWIHITDLCNIYLKAIMDENMDGAYNAVAPQHVNHNEFVRTMATVMKRPLFLPPVPASVLRALLGEMADIVLKGSRISSDKVIGAGYDFRFARLDEALRNVISG